MSGFRCLPAKEGAQRSAKFGRHDGARLRKQNLSNYVIPAVVLSHLKALKRTTSGCGLAVRDFIAPAP